MPEPYYGGGPLPSAQAGPVHVVLDNLRSAFNVGSIFRSADAAGIGCLHLCGITCWPPHPKLEKTSLGAHQYVQWRRYPTTLEALEQLKQQGIPLVALENSPTAPTIADFAWPRPVGLIFGHEVVGVSPEALALCDHILRIPMVGSKNSLNVASAFAVVAFHLAGAIRC